MLNLTITELRSISKERRNINEYKGMSIKQLEDLFTKPQKSKYLCKPRSKKP